MFDFKLEFKDILGQKRSHDVFHDYDVTEGKSIFILIGN